MKRVLIIGAGGIGGRHIRGFLKTKRATLAICEPDDTKRHFIQDKYGIEEAFGDTSEAPLDTFDAAVISAPAHVHVPIAQTLVEADLSFLTEKPLSVTMEGVDALVDAVRKKDLTVRVGYVIRLRPWIIAAHTQCAEGRIGDVRMAYVNFSQDYRKYRPDYADSYYAKEAMGGGAILDCATHIIDLLLWFMGPVTEVSAIYDRLAFENVECEDSALISLRFATGGMAQINVNQFQQPNAATIEFVGEKANLKIDNCTGCLSYADNDSGKWQTEDYIKGGQTAMEIHESMFATQANAFLDVLEGKPDQLATLHAARENLCICHAAKESYRTKSIISL